MNQPEVVYLNQTDFRSEMLALRRKGGPFQLAYQSACNIIESLRLGADVANRITNNGESRINHAVKYDLGHGCRLVTVQTDNYIYLLFVGTHDDTERWLDKSRGLRITINPQTRAVRVVQVSQSGDPNLRRLPNNDIYTEENVPFFRRIPAFDISEWVKQSFLRTQLLRIDEATQDSEIEELIVHIQESDKKLAYFLFDLICELKKGAMNGAMARIEKEKGSAVPVEDVPEIESQAVSDANNSQYLANLSDMSKEDVERLFSPDGFRDWMLFLHADQKRIAHADYDKPTVLTGVSGSGKTVILVHRARYLARKYPQERIGVVTLSRSLARLISNQLDELCKPEVRKQIHVLAYYDYIKGLVEEFGPDEYLKQLREAAKGHDYEVDIIKTIDRVDPERFVREFDPLSGESLADTWDIFINEPGAQTQFAYFVEQLEKYQGRIDGEIYLQEELSLVRSAFSTRNRGDEYPALERHGRAIPLPEAVRKRVLDLLMLYEETMLHGGILDVLSLTSAALPHLMRIRDLPAEKRFRCLLVDEFQDFSTLDLSVLRRIPTNLNEDGLFLTGDPVQRVLVKDLRMGAVGLDIISANRVRIQKNYRNSKQILEAAFLLAKEYALKAKELGEDVEILDPELTVRETAAPVVEAVPPGGELTRAWQIVSDCIRHEQAQPWSITICTACPTKISIEDIIAAKPEDLDADATHLSGDYTEQRRNVTVGTLPELKGFEFSLVIVVGCGSECLPQPGRCKDEVWRDALRLYVAMTRARDSVYLLHSGEPSPFLEAMREKVAWSEPVTA